MHAVQYLVSTAQCTVESWAPGAIQSPTTTNSAVHTLVVVLLLEMINNCGCVDFFLNAQLSWDYLKWAVAMSSTIRERSVLVTLDDDCFFYYVVVQLSGDFSK